MKKRILKITNYLKNHREHKNTLEKAVRKIDNESYYMIFEMIENYADLQLFILSNDFAEALWKEDWKYHLQQMVVERKPIEYLEKNL